jgi:hypothetical protein
MRIARTIALCSLALVVSSCGRPTEAQREAAPAAKTEKKCPDPNIHDSTDPCSPNYYKPVQGSFKDDKGL